MAKSKKVKIDGYFFMSICNGELDVNCSGDENVLSAAFATILLDETKEGKQAKQLLTTAVAISAHELQFNKVMLIIFSYILTCYMVNGRKKYCAKSCYTNEKKLI